MAGLTTCSAEGAPISLLGALDVALYRQRDPRFRAYAAEAVTKLCGETFGRQPDIDMYHLVWMFRSIRIQPHQFDRERIEATGILEADVFVDAGSIDCPHLVRSASHVRH